MSFCIRWVVNGVVHECFVRDNYNTACMVHEALVGDGHVVEIWEGRRRLR